MEGTLPKKLPTFSPRFDLVTLLGHSELMRLVEIGLSVTVGFAAIRERAAAMYSAEGSVASPETLITYRCFSKVRKLKVLSLMIGPPTEKPKLWFACSGLLT